MPEPMLETNMELTNSVCGQYSSYQAGLLDKETVNIAVQRHIVRQVLAMCIQFETLIIFQ